MFAVLMNGKCSISTTCAISGERFAWLLSCCSPLLLRWHPGNKHCKAVQKRVAQLSVFKHGLLSWGRETEAIFQHTVLPGSVVLRPEHHISCFSLRSFLAPYRCHVFFFSLKRVVLSLYSAKIICETQSTKLLNTKANEVKLQITY